MKRLSVLLLSELCILFVLLFVIHHFALDYRVRRIIAKHDAVLSGDSLVVRGIENAQLERASGLRVCKVAWNGAGVYGSACAHTYASELGKLHLSGISYPMLNRKLDLDYNRYPFRPSIILRFMNAGFPIKELLRICVQSVGWEISVIPSPSRPLPKLAFLHRNNLDTPIREALDLKELEDYEEMACAAESGLTNFHERFRPLVATVEENRLDREIFFRLQTSKMLNDIIATTAPSQAELVHAELEGLSKSVIFVGEFIDGSKPDQYYFSDLTHLNVRGRALATEELARKVRDALSLQSLQSGL